MNTNMMIGTGVVMVGLIGSVSAFLVDDETADPRARARRIAYQVTVYGILPILAGLFFFAAGWTARS